MPFDSSDVQETAESGTPAIQAPPARIENPSEAMKPWIEGVSLHPVLPQYAGHSLHTYFGSVRCTWPNEASSATDVPAPVCLRASAARANRLVGRRCAR